MSRPRLFINHDAGYDWLIALEFGRVDDGQPPECWRKVSEEAGFLEDRPGGPAVGFKVVGFSEFDVESDEAAELWDGPRFDAPLVGLTDVPAAEIIVAARTLLGGHSTVNRQFFHAAVAADDRAEAVDRWLGCLECGDSMAHFGLGYTLYDLGEYHDAYRHLRHYTEIAPACSWAWCWYGYACEAIGELGEARQAYQRALELEEDGGEETDAEERLEALEA